MDPKTPTMDEFLAAIESLKEKAVANLSTAENLAAAVMNLVGAAY